MSLAKAVASRGALYRPSIVEMALKGGSFRLLSTRFASSVIRGKPLSTRAALRGVRAWRGNAKGIYQTRTATWSRWEQPTRSLGIFADGGSGISHRMLKELERKAARAPSDPNAEVKRDFNIFLPIFL